MTKKVIRHPRFVLNKYFLWYDKIILGASERLLLDYTERHHILPRSLGGGNEKSNLVDLTFREHFLAHWLLTKFTTGNAQKSMLVALNWICNGNGGGKVFKKRRGIISSWRYYTARRAARDAQIGRMRPNMHSEKFKTDLRLRMAGNVFNKGKKYLRSPEFLEKMKWTEERRALAKEKIVNFEVRKKISEKLKGRSRPDVSAALKGRKQTPEQIAANKAAWTDERREATRARFKGKKRPGGCYWLKGKTRDPELVAKSAAWHRGQKRSPETCAAISASKKGKKQPKISDALKGRKCPWISEANKNRQVSLETRAKISETSKGHKYPNRKKGHVAWNKGVPSTAECKAKISASLKNHASLKGRKCPWVAEANRRRKHLQDDQPQA